MNDGDREKRIEACSNTLPADHRAAVLSLEPGKRALGLEARDVLFDWAPTRLLGLPDPFGELGPDTASAQSMAELFGIVPVICREDLEPLTRSAPPARADVEGIQQRGDLGSLVAIRRRGARGHWHASRVREAVDEDAFAFPAMRDALTAAFARGKKHHRQHRTATESCHVLQPTRAAWLASPRGCHRPASAAATDGRHSWPPTAGRAGDHTSGSR
jgi:hypothetical protein